MNLQTIYWTYVSQKLAQAAFAIIVIMLFGLLVALLTRPAVSPLEKGVLSKTLAFNMVIWRAMTLRASQERTLSTPLEMVWWVVVAILLLHFGYTLITGYYGPVLWPRVRRMANRVRRMFMRTRTVLALVILSLVFGIAAVKAQEGPILLEQGTTENDVPGPIVEWNGSEIMVEEAKGPVQGIIVRKTEEIVGGDVVTSVDGMVAIKTRNGWVAADETFFVVPGDVGEWANVQVTQGWHMALDTE